MAGGNGTKKDPKKTLSKNFFGNESFAESQPDYSPAPPVKFTLRGVLGIGQTVELNKTPNHSKEIFSTISHIHQEQNILFDQRQKELKKALDELRREISLLSKSTNNLEKSVEVISLVEIPDASEYQVNFLIRIRNFISNVRQNINEAGLWVQAFAAKKKKKNYFWNTAKNKKKGGDAFLFSEEHSVARSIG